MGPESPQIQLIGREAERQRLEAGVFPPHVGWHCQDCPVRSRCWAWG